MVRGVGEKGGRCGKGGGGVVRGEESGGCILVTLWGALRFGSFFKVFEMFDCR